MTYDELIKSNLASYKLKRLGVEQNGVWKKNNSRYKHILSECLKNLNILETFRREFWEYYESGQLGAIKLHPDFHHLNSSQAMAFNLFFPFMYQNKLFLPLLLDSLDIAFGEVTEVDHHFVLFRIHFRNILIQRKPQQNIEIKQR
jgi:hypothetical protein